MLKTTIEGLRAACDRIYIEDSERGLTTAKAAGLECWVIPTPISRGGDFRSADRVLSSLAEVAALLGSHRLTCNLSTARGISISR